MKVDDQLGKQTGSKTLSIDPEKEKPLASNGYRFIGDVLCFVNRSAGKVFTRAFIDDHDINALLSCIHSVHGSPTWKVFHNPGQVPFVQEILRTLGKPA